MNCLLTQIFFKNFREFGISKGHVLDFKVGRAAMGQHADTLVEGAQRLVGITLVLSG